MCDERDHRGHHRHECRDEGHHRGRGRHRGQMEGRGPEDCGPQEHYLHGCDCPLEVKIVYLERMVAYKKADVAALESIIEVLKESLNDDEEEQS